jgi:hypothetical protein
MSPNLLGERTLEVREHEWQRVFDESDDEWESPLDKISRLPAHHDSWQDAREIIEPPSAACHKIGDESRSLAARHIIDRLKEENLVDEIEDQSPRLRSAVELLSKPEADFVYPAVAFMVNQLRRKYPSSYNSIVNRTQLSIPQDELPSQMLVTLAKKILEKRNGEIGVNWGKFISILTISGALAIDSVKNGYPDGVIEVVETFGCLVEQFMADWMLSPEGGGGWESFIKENSYDAMLPPIPRAIVIILFFLFVISLLVPYFVAMVQFLISFWQGVILFLTSFISDGAPEKGISNHSEL